MTSLDEADVCYPLPVCGKEFSVPCTSRQCLCRLFSSYTNTEGILLVLCLKGRFVLWFGLDTMDFIFYFSFLHH